MNIEISDEQIEKLLEKQINERVKTWFQQDEHKFIIKEYTNKAVMKELENFEYDRIVREEARKQINGTIVGRVCARVSQDIADAFAEKYGDY
jgi:hypothetical protein